MGEGRVQAQNCPLCGQDNRCGNVLGKQGEPCWCGKESFPPAIFAQVPEELLRKSCICKDCLKKFKQGLNLQE